MKKACIFILVVLMIGQINAQTKEPDERNNLLSVSLTRLFLSNMSFTYERLFNSSGLAVSGGITLTDNRDMSKTGMNAELQYRVYPNLRKDKSFQGIYLAPYVSYRYLEETFRNNYSQDNEFDREWYRSYGLGVVFGMKVAIAKRIVFTYELGGGLKLTDGTQKASRYDIIDPGYTGIVPRADISLGYFF